MAECVTSPDTCKYRTQVHTSNSVVTSPLHHTDTHLARVEASTTEAATPKHVDAHVHLPTSPGCHGRTELQRAVIPVVVEKDAITETKE